ncbi:MAG TPA: hypothetical protein IAC21_03560 [Candidatus Enterenecus merdae]|nr:hypothetical protein [Candidatus Enterenecus merdae]
MEGGWELFWATGLPQAWLLSRQGDCPAPAPGNAKTGDEGRQDGQRT